jgi:hypothetical protein
LGPTQKHIASWNLEFGKQSSHSSCFVNAFDWAHVWNVTDGDLISAERKVVAVPTLCLKVDPGKPVIHQFFASY